MWIGSEARENIALHKICMVCELEQQGYNCQQLYGSELNNCQTVGYIPTGTDSKTCICASVVKLDEIRRVDACQFSL